MAICEVLKSILFSLNLKKNSIILNGLNHSYPLTGAEPEMLRLRSE
ncbi:hypothetical protein COO91_09601 (plasmid) [Nostoc flagelliforme CCNUN1]|uniref:Uncharacterized protein n=1 Tax=Nostoc flagelliforme CCNUN1 TaxID=2038116 RepID=A0A2K8T6V7_9NOSO|nr:hypothetical protein COO91_09601 [Nostoc flagelliforme CCNUN1]